MSEDSDDAGGERLLLVMLLGGTIGAVFGIAVLGDTTHGVVVGITAGTVCAAALPAWTDRVAERVSELLES